MQTGLTVREYMNNCRYAVNGARVRFEGVEYYAGAVREDGHVELYVDVKHEQADAIGHMDLVEFI